MEWTIEALTQLDDRAMEKIKELVQTCESFDGVEVPMQWNHEMNARKEMASWLIAWQEDECIGVLALFGPCSDEIEFSGCVHPAYRNKGIWTQLIENGRLCFPKKDVVRQLFMCDRQSQTGTGVAKKKKCEIHHTEFAMQFDKSSSLPQTTSIEVIKAGMDAINDIAIVEMDSFGMSIEDAHHLAQNAISSKSRTTYVGKVSGNVVAICSISHDTKESVGINGLAVIKSERGNGYGKAMIVEILKLLKEDSRDILLDVDSVNAVAYTLYKSIGFKEIQAVDYYM